MSIITTVLVFGSVSVVLFWVAAIVLWKKSYKYPCMVAVQSGDDVIWVHDHFKTREKDGYSEIRFFKNKGRSYSPPSRFWSSWVKKKEALPVDDGWFKMDSKKLRNMITRGAFFVKISDDEYAVAKLDVKTATIRVLDYDSRQLVLENIRKRREVTASFKEKLIQMGIWLGSLLVITILVIVILTLTFKYSGEQAQEIIKLAAQQAAAQAPVGG